MVLARSSVLEVDATPTSALPLRSAGIRWGKGVSTISAFTPSAFARSLQVSTSKPIGLLSASREPIGGKSRVTAQRSFPELIMSSSLSAFAGATAARPKATTRHKVLNIPASWFRDAILSPAAPENAPTPTTRPLQGCTQSTISFFPQTALGPETPGRALSGGEAFFPGPHRQRSMVREE
jgi:hypothetical protein